MRPLGPLPFTSASGTPSSRAKRRTDGDACGRLVGAEVGSCGGNAAVGEVRCTVAVPGAAAAGATGCTGDAADVGAGAGVAAPAAPSISATTEPCDTLSPSLTLISLITPPCDAGISIDALSLSTVIKLCSGLTVSPGLMKTSITATSLKSPMSGTRSSITPPPPAGAASGAGTGAAAAATCGICVCTGVGALGGAAAPLAASSNSSGDPSLILSPSATFSSLTTPSALDGISIDALSLSTVIRLCSALTVSPGLTSNSMTATSLKSPMSGTRTSTSAIRMSPVVLLRRTAD